jgi:predicted RNase H-like HicB family nuclease
MSLTQTTPAAGSLAVLVLADRADDGGWGTFSPHVPGVFGHGDSVDEAVQDWRAAVAFARESGWELQDVDVVSDEHDVAVFTRIPV